MLCILTDVFRACSLICQHASITEDVAHLLRARAILDDLLKQPSLHCKEHILAKLF